MEFKRFNVGDKVRLVHPANYDFETQDWEAKNGFKIGDVFTVARVQNDGWLTFGDEPFFSFHGRFEYFVKEKVPVIIILRREQDRKAVLHALTKRGYDTEMARYSKSRVIITHPESHDYFKENTTTFNGMCNWKTSVKDCIKSSADHLTDYFKYTDYAVVKTKPSVNKAIEELNELI